jgi:hypothetical protein
MSTAETISGDRRLKKLAEGIYSREPRRAVEAWRPLERRAAPGGMDEPPGAAARKPVVAGRR